MFVKAKDMILDDKKHVLFFVSSQSNESFSSQC